MKSRVIDWLALMTVFGAMIWLLSMAQCARWTPPDDPPRPATACEAMCETGAKLGCVWAEPTPEGTTCQAICEETEQTGWTTMHPACVATAKSCLEAEYLGKHGCE